MAEYVTATGLEIPTVETLMTEIREELRADVDPLLAVSSVGPSGQIAGTIASHLREGWEGVQVAFTSLDPNKAEDEILDGVCLFTGTRRLQPTKSRFKGPRQISVNLDDGATVTAGVTLFHVAGRPDILVTPTADSRFDVDGVFTNTTGVTDDFLFDAECTQTGPIIIAAGTLTEITTPAAGLNSVTNPLDAIVGRNLEKDEDLRVRRVEELAQQGGSTADALRAELEAYRDAEDAAPIISACVLENVSDATDANGLPPHSFEAVIWDGPGQDADNTAVSEIIRNNRPAGIRAFGSLGTTGYNFSRASQVDTELEVTLRFRASSYVGDAAVKEALSTAFQAHQRPNNGGDEPGLVPFSVYLETVMGLAGVSRVTLFRSRFSGGAWASFTDLAPAVREVAVTDTTLITVLSAVE